MWGNNKKRSSEQSLVEEDEHYKSDERERSPDNFRDIEALEYEWNALPNLDAFENDSASFIHPRNNNNNSSSNTMGRNIINKVLSLANSLVPIVIDRIESRRGELLEEVVEEEHDDVTISGDNTVDDAAYSSAVLPTYIDSSSSMDDDLETGITDNNTIPSSVRLLDGEARMLLNRFRDMMRSNDDGSVVVDGEEEDDRSLGSSGSDDSMDGELSRLNSVVHSLQRDMARVGDHYHHYEFFDGATEDALRLKSWPALNVHAVIWSVALIWALVLLLGRRFDDDSASNEGFHIFSIWKDLLKALNITK